MADRPTPDSDQPSPSYSPPRDPRPGWIGDGFLSFVSVFSFVSGFSFVSVFIVAPVASVLTDAGHAFRRPAARAVSRPQFPYQ